MNTSIEGYNLTDGKDLFIMRRHSPIDRVKLFFYAWDELLNLRLESDEAINPTFKDNWTVRKDGFFGCMERSIFGYSTGEGCVENGKMVYMITGVISPDKVPNILNWLMSLIRKKINKEF